MMSAETPSPGPSSPVLVIMGSVRAGRRCPQVAAWVKGLAEAASNLSYEVVDLADWHLPMVDEPDIPVRGNYVQEHTPSLEPQDRDG